MFSRRLVWDRAPNALALAEAARRASGADLIDLTESNPTRVGLPYPTRELEEALVGGRGELARYEPAPFGMPAARAAVAASYAAAGVVAGTGKPMTIDGSSIVLTASSSESYSYLFKLLCDPGDAVLVPEPSYPLFEYLARLEGVRHEGYRLHGHGDWTLDAAEVEAAAARAEAAGSRPRAVVVVSPNNPTGSFLRPRELASLQEVCLSRDLALISDEVFADYATCDCERVAAVAAEPLEVLGFSLGGLSKSCGLPHLKLGWIAAGGPAGLVRDALARLELVADSYLSVSSPVQLALPRLLQLGAGIRAAIMERVARNRAMLADAVVGSPVTLLPAEGGWCAILRVPAARTDEEWTLSLLRDDGVLVQPGYFFDLPAGPFLVVSLLPEPAAFARAASLLVARAQV